MYFRAFELTLCFTNVWIIFVLVCFVTCPRDPISNGNNEHANPALSMSAFNDVYLVVFL